jgi:glycerol-1-phosphate dehydrogenase [NAD(P)+]
MTDVDATLDGLLGRSFACECGQTHVVPTRHVTVGGDVIERVPELLGEVADAQRVLVVADRRTWHAAGERIDRALRPAHAVTAFIIADDRSGTVHASLEQVSTLEAALPDLFDLYIAVGSGTVNDITKALAHRRGRPYAVVPTAASMNGYTSSIVSLLDQGLKTTAAATPPVAVFADTGVLADAPLELTLAGLGDLVSKPFCGCDWWIASVVKGERYCPLPGRILDDAFAGTLEEMARLGERDADAVAVLTRLLLVSGITMTVAGTSSPASGGEHLLSRYWDMVNLRDGRPLRLHGAQVGVASVAMDALYATVAEADFAAAAFCPNPSEDQARSELGDVFGALTDSVWPQWKAKIDDRSERDLAQLADHEQAIKTEIRKVLAIGARIRAVLAACGAPTLASDLDITAPELEAALRHGRTIRARYTVLDVAAELGLLDAFARDYSSRGKDDVN